MQTLTAHRTFGDAGYSPARRVRIFSDRWYQVVMQTVEHDQGGGMYLGDGEYVEIVPGTEARNRKTARLNHCNGIREYKGEVWTATTRDPSCRPVYYPTLAAAQAAVDGAHADGLLTLAEKVIPKLTGEINATDDELRAHWGRCSDWAGAEAHREEQRVLLARNRVYWGFKGEARRVR